MNIIKLTKEQLLYLLNCKSYNQGSYGILKDFDDTTLIKIYYKDIFKTYNSLDETNLDIEINKLIQKDKKLAIYEDDYVSKLQHLKKIYNLLKNTKSNSLIKGIVTYNNYPIGILLEKYKDYEILSRVYEKLNKKDKIKVLKLTKKLMFNLIKKNIFPTDIKANNILVNPNTLDVKLIDLDGFETIIESKKNIKQYYNKKNDCVNRFNKMIIRLDY